MDVEQLLSELETLSEASREVRLDGEVLLPDGGAVAWRELASHPHRLLKLGPGDGLSRMAGDALPSVSARYVSEFKTLEGVCSWVRRQLEG